MSPEIEQHDLDSQHPEPSRARKFLWAAGAIAVVLVLGLIVHARIASHRGPGNFGGGFRPANAGFGGPLAVGVAQATTGDVPITIDSLGTVTPLATVTVHPMVTGPLIEIPFSEGQTVKAGQLLAQIDPRPFQAALDQAQGQLEHDEALLANARVDLERYKTLMAQNSVAEQTYATQQATVLQDEATVVSDKAALDTAKLNLGYTHITSPVNGSVGLRQVDNGNVVSAYSSEIAVVTQLQPMSVLFTIPEDDLEEVLQRLHRGEKLPVVAYDRTFTTKLDSGVLSNNDNEVDTTTGTLKLRAMFSNAALELFPSQFVNIRLTLDTLHNQVLVPGSAVQMGSSGDYIYVVDPAEASSEAFDPPGDQGGSGSEHRRGRRFSAFNADVGPVHIVHVRYVTTGPSTGNLISIRDGLQPGETVVIDGAEQLRDGAQVTVPNAPAANPSAPSDAGAAATPDAAGQPAAAGTSSAIVPASGSGVAGGAAYGYGYGSRRLAGAGGAAAAPYRGAAHRGAGSSHSHTRRPAAAAPGQSSATTPAAPSGTAGSP